MSLLALSNVSVRYGRLTAVRGVTFTLAEGEILFITGPNGAGKSSLLRAIAGVTPPAGGRIDLSDHDITGRPPEDIARLGLSMVPEGREVFGSLTIEENLMVGTGMHSATRGWKARAASELEAVYATFPILKDRRNSQAGLLSGGQQQMLVIGRALMTSPRLVAIDEPSLGLAPNITDQVYERLIALQSERKLTLLIVEQSSTRAMLVGGRMMLMRGGEIVAGRRRPRPGAIRGDAGCLFRLWRPLMGSLLQVVFDALSLGSLYALGALGIALIFGVMRLVNFAHGDVIAFSIFALLWPSVDAVAIVFAGNLPWFLLIPFVLAIGAGLSVAVRAFRLPPVPPGQPGYDDDRLFRAGLRDPLFPADAFLHRVRKASRFCRSCRNPSRSLARESRSCR